MLDINGVSAPESTTLQFQLIRNTTSPDEKDVGVSSYVLNVPFAEILKIGTQDNLRIYIGYDNARKRNRVHQAIRGTIDTSPKRFIVRNSGFVVTASQAELDDAKKSVTLKNASIINGAQSQGEIRRYYDECKNENLPTEDFFVRIELIVDPDQYEVVETAIARNTATPVKDITQVGGRGHLDELEKAIKREFPNLEIQKSETDSGEDTRLILQKIRLLMPASVSGSESSAERLRAYKNPAQCLTDFSQWSENKDQDEDAKRRYDFCIQMAAHAIKEYKVWESHPAWNKHRIWEQTKKGGRACRRDKANKIVWIAPGILFPVFGALSEFIHEEPSGSFKYVVPKGFSYDKMIERAARLFRAEDSNPMNMGRSESAYDGLRFYTETLRELSA